MQTDAARKLIKETFEKPFDKQQFSTFIKNLLNHVEEAPFTYRGNYIYDDFKDKVESLERIGKYNDQEGSKADILIVHLKRATSLDRARTAQRQFVAKYLKGGRGGEMKDAALVAFVSPDEEDWRFSFVKMEYKIETTDKGRIKAKEEFTPAKRYSFIVGKNENSHTAQSQLLPILEDTDNSPTLKDLESRFSVEKVTKEFFEKYRELFLEIKEALDKLVKKDKEIKLDFESKGVETASFSKKLLGQVVFLYFLQKKGWFGVGKRNAWGTGSKKFLRELFEKKYGNYNNFFNDLLEPLFYNTLAVERPEDYSDKFDCRVPFLNGGLFDPLGNYNWQSTDILLPNELFSNRVKTKQGDIGTGILDVFDRYNFTVKEDEPLEKEVAVDPEMLGKVFENLLEVKDRKSKGTYYTPREIVHYMCQESLINYLTTELESIVSQNEIETLVKHGESAVDNDIQVLEKGRETYDYSFKLPDSIRENADEINEKLRDIKVCDPAVGSGAFLVGMMTEIVRTSSVLTEFLAKSKRLSAYDMKRYAIQNSLYGVDIDPGAVEIAKLRLWLSMIVDEDDYRQIKPLPNLDYKIMQGNSLFEKYEGIKLIDERFFTKAEDRDAIQKHLKEVQSNLQREYIGLDASRKLTAIKKLEIEKRLKEIEKQLSSLDKPTGNGQNSFSMFGKTDVQAKAEKLMRLHQAFFEASHKWEKDELKDQIDKLTWDLIEATLKHEKKSGKLEELRLFQKMNTRPFFLWKLNFAEVFKENRGFDVMIANPPYVVLAGNLFNEYKWTKGNNNTYVAFLETALRLISCSGVITYIIPTTWLAGNNFASMRSSLLERHSIQQIVQLPYDIFEVYVDNLILVVTGPSVLNQKVKTFKFDIRAKMNHSFSFTEFDPAEWMRNSESPIFLDRDLTSILRRYSSIHYKLLGDIAKVQRGTLPPKDNEILKGKSPEKKDDLIDWFTGQIHRYQIVTGPRCKIQYSCLRENKPLELFEKPKILGRQLISRQFRLQFAYFDKICAFKKNLYAIYDLDENFEWYYLLAILNSKFYSYIQVRLNASGQRDDFPAFSLQDYRNFLIPDIPKPTQAPFARLAKQIETEINKTGDENELAKLTHHINQIDENINQMVYKLYGLTPEEIAVVEGKPK